MSKIKYTTDGKKVAIVGKLNSKETIVQEIFISEGNEIPSGENFVVKSLHDKPVESWKEKNLRELDERYDRLRRNKEEEMRRYRKVCSNAISDFTQKIDYFKKSIKELNDDSFSLFVDFITGKVKYIVTYQYGLEIKKFEDFTSGHGDRLKLFSVFGRDDGSLMYCKNTYSDESGGKSKFIPCYTKEEALKVVKQKFDEKERYHDKCLKDAKIFGFELDPVKLKNYKEQKVKGYQSYIKNYKEKISDYKHSIKQIKTIQ